jgi:NO-binding membrane sensor protein with MHYT domain
MLKLLDCIVLEHDQVTFMLAALICLASTQVMFLLLRRVDECAEARKPLWLIVAASAGGLGIWATHFLAMLAYRSSIMVSFDWLVTGLSALVAVGGVLESLILVGRKTRAWTFAAAVLLAGTVATMHFMGMMAMEGLSRQSYDFVLMFWATIFAVGAFSLAYAGQRSGVRGLRQVAPGLLVAAGIVVLHFGDMAACWRHLHYRCHHGLRKCGGGTARSLSHRPARHDRGLYRGRRHCARQSHHRTQCALSRDRRL